MSIITLWKVKVKLFLIGKELYESYLMLKLKDYD